MWALSLCLFVSHGKDDMWARVPVTRRGSVTTVVTGPATEQHQHVASLSRWCCPATADLRAPPLGSSGSRGRLSAAFSLRPAGRLSTSLPSTTPLRSSRAATGIDHRPLPPLPRRSTPIPYNSSPATLEDASGMSRPVLKNASFILGSGERDLGFSRFSGEGFFLPADFPSFFSPYPTSQPCFQTIVHLQFWITEYKIVSSRVIFHYVYL